MVRGLCVALLLPATVRPAAAAGTTCRPLGLSLRYPTMYIAPGDYGTIGEVYGWDVSNPDYRDPVGSGDEGIPGGVVTQTYTNSLAKLYVGSEWIALEDEKYRDCLGIAAILDLNAPRLYHEDSFPYWQPYPETTTRMNNPVLRMIEGDWFKFWDTVEPFLDAQLSAGNSTLIYDGKEGCGGATAAAAAYLIRKDSITAQEAVENIVALRPCSDDGMNETTSPDVFEKLEGIAAGLGGGGTSRAGAW